jgi:transcription elongation GreA/GreB family factor
VALSAVVVIEIDGKRKHVFIAPAGVGVRLRAGSIEVQVVTPTSPLGEALVGAKLGDVVNVERGDLEEEVEIVSVA